MGKDDEARIGIGIDSSSDETVDPNDPVYWDEATLRENAKEWVFEQQGRYRGNPRSRDMVLTDEQQRVVVDHVVKYWMPKDIDEVVLLAEEDDRAQTTPRKPEDSYAVAIRNIYKRKLDEGKSEREALGKVKDLVASRLSDRDLKGLPDIAAVHARQMINQLANWKPRPKIPNPYSRYL